MLARYSFRSQVVDRLEAIRSAILQPWGQPVDFLKRNSFDQAGPGLHFGLEAKTAYKAPVSNIASDAWRGSLGVWRIDGGG